MRVDRGIFSHHRHCPGRKACLARPWTSHLYYCISTASSRPCMAWTWYPSFLDHATEGVHVVDSAAASIILWGACCGHAGQAEAIISDHLRRLLFYISITNILMTTLQCICDSIYMPSIEVSVSPGHGSGPSTHNLMTLCSTNQTHIDLPRSHGSTLQKVTYTAAGKSYATGSLQVWS